MQIARTTLLALLIACACIGLVDSWYLAESAATDSALFCNVEGFDGCNTVAQSPYAKISGIPLGFFGIAFYGALLALSVAALTRRHHLLWFALVALTGVGVLASLGFLYIQLVLIQAFCIYCLISAALTFLSLPVALLLKKDFLPHEEVVQSA